MKNFFFIIAFLSAVLSSHAQIINVSDFGAKPNSFEDATEGVKRAIEACRKIPNAQLVFPEGRYDFWPEKTEKREYFISNTSSETDCPSKVKNIGLLFENMKDLLVEGNGSQFIFHGKMITWAIDKSSNIKMQNFSVDFERPSMSEITVSELHPSYIIATIHPDSRYTIVDGKVCFYGEGWVMNENLFAIQTSLEEGTNMYTSWEPILNAKATEIAPNKLRLEYNYGETNYKEGHTITIRNHIRDHVGVFINQSKNIQLENIALHYMHGLGVVSQFSENLTYNKVSITPSRGRTIAAFADGMHFSGCKGLVKVENCQFRGLHDDPLNFHGTYLQITEVQSPTKLKVKFMHHQTYGFPAFFEQDTVAFIYAKALQTKGRAVVKKAIRISDREMELELSAPLPTGIGVNDCIENLTWTPSLEVRNNRFEGTNTRGLLITTPRKVLVDGNHFYRTGMYAIQISGDAESWYESGAVNDVTITNNIFEECGYNRSTDDRYSIALNPENHEELNNYWVHRNIKIQNNIFKVLGTSLLKAKSTKGILFDNNTIESSDFLPADTSVPSFKFEHCANVILKNNKYKWDFPIVQVAYSKMKKGDIKIEKGMQLKSND